MAIDQLFRISQMGTLNCFDIDECFEEVIVASLANLALTLEGLLVVRHLTVLPLDALTIAKKVVVAV